MKLDYPSASASGSVGLCEGTQPLIRFPTPPPAPLRTTAHIRAGVRCQVAPPNARSSTRGPARFPLWPLVGDGRGLPAHSQAGTAPVHRAFRLEAVLVAPTAWLRTCALLSPLARCLFCPLYHDPACSPSGWTPEHDLALQEACRQHGMSVPCRCPSAQTTARACPTTLSAPSHRVMSRSPARLRVLCC